MTTPLSKTVRAVLWIGLTFAGRSSIALETLWVSSAMHTQEADQDSPGAIDLQPTNGVGAVGSFLFSEWLFGAPHFLTSQSALTVVETGPGTWNEVWVSSLVAPHFLMANNNHHHVLRDIDGTTHILYDAYEESPYLSPLRLEYRNSSTLWAVEPLEEGNISSESLALDPHGGVHAVCTSDSGLRYFFRGSSTWTAENIPHAPYTPWGSLSLSVGNDLRPVVGFRSGSRLVLLRKNGAVWPVVKDMDIQSHPFLLRIESLDRFHLAIVDWVNDTVRYVRLSSAGVIQKDLHFPAPNVINPSQCGLALDENNVAHIAVTSVLINTETAVSTPLPVTFQIPSIAFVGGGTPYLFGLLANESPRIWMALAPLQRSSPPVIVNRSTDSLTWSWDSFPSPISEIRLIKMPDRQDLTGPLPPDRTQWTLHGLGPNAAQRVVARAAYPGFVTESTSSLLAHTLANPPSEFRLLRPEGQPLTASWQMNGNPTGTRFKLRLTPPSGVVFTDEVEDAGWSAPALDFGHPYAVTICAVNGDDIETAGPSVTHVSFSGATREWAFSLEGDLSVTVRVVGPPTMPEPVVAVLPADSFPPAPAEWSPTGVGFRVLAAPSFGSNHSAIVTCAWPIGRSFAPPGLPLQLARFDPSEGRWIPLLTSESTGALSARVAGDGVFQIMANGSRSANLGLSQALPNPFRPDREPLTIRGAVPGTEIHIMDVRGRSVRGLIVDADGTAAWNGNDTAGNPAGSGIYSIAVGNESHPPLRVLLKR